MQWKYFPAHRRCDAWQFCNQIKVPAASDQLSAIFQQLLLPKFKQSAFASQGEISFPGLIEKGEQHKEEEETEPESFCIGI